MLSVRAKQRAPTRVTNPHLTVLRIMAFGIKVKMESLVVFKTISMFQISIEVSLGTKTSSTTSEIKLLNIFSNIYSLIRIVVLPC